MTSNPRHPDLLARLPKLPTNRIGDGYDWMQRLNPAWRPIPAWGHRGWDLGAWPHQIVCHHSNPRGPVFGLLTFCEHDLDITAYPTRHERDHATDRLAAAHWRRGDATGPTDLLGDDDGLLPHHRGPHQSPRRALIYTRSGDTPAQTRALLARGYTRAAQWHYSIVGELIDTPNADDQLAYALTAMRDHVAAILLTPTLATLDSRTGLLGDVVAQIREAGGRVEAFVEVPDLFDVRTGR